VLKPIGTAFTNKTVDTENGTVSNITIEPASQAEIDDTVAVMGGEDWEMWINALDEAKLIAPGATTMAYSYIGPEVTWPVYKNGTIGMAKNDLEAASKRINATMRVNGYGSSFVSVNKALVTQASSAIPVVPLYISILYKIMKARGLHEGCIEQMDRLYRTHLYGGNGLQFDEAGRVRIDDWEMRPEVQAEVARIWPEVTSANLSSLTDIAGYRTDFLKLFGFGLAGVNYDADTDPHVVLP
jgi:enoyl-[acyl-carrier protein] reductase/trans-2-enoyl-CoA reductase (NAD+)